MIAFSSIKKRFDVQEYDMYIGYCWQSRRWQPISIDYHLAVRIRTYHPSCSSTRIFLNPIYCTSIPEKISHQAQHLPHPGTISHASFHRHCRIQCSQGSASVPIAGPRCVYVYLCMFLFVCSTRKLQHTHTFVIDSMDPGLERIHILYSCWDPWHRTWRGHFVSLDVSPLHPSLLAIWRLLW